MAQAPTPTPSAPPGAAAGGMGGMTGGDPMAGAGGGGGDADMDSDDNVVVTICKNGDGSYTVYAGDEPEGGAGDTDMSEDDTEAMGPAGGAPPNGGASAPQGQQADSIGAALKAAMDIMNSDKSSEGAPGNADDQLNAGFSANQSPTPATGAAQKY